jgi:3-deoxy-D-manno-octulosonic-acid transferase
VAERLPLTFAAYRLLTHLATPLASHLLRYRLERGKEDPARLRERRGEASVARPQGPLVWLHGASVGELLAVLPLIGRIRARGLAVLVTSGTLTSAALARTRLPQGAIHQFVPLDAPSFVARFLDHWRPDLALFVESDLWPNLVLTSARRGIPLILVNGRLSARSFARWGRVPRTIEALLKSFDLCLVRSAEDAQRFGALGAPRLATTGNLKLDVPALPVDPIKLARLKSATAGRTIVIAASTHPGEETMVTDAHRRLKHSFPGLLTIVVPRHPDRGAEIADIAAASGLSAAMRSRGDLPGPATDIYVCDTLGELGLVYRLAPIVFMGGSLVPHGGQNPIEPIKLGAAVLHGPHVQNFADIYGALDQTKGAQAVSDAGHLTVCLGALLTDAAARRRLIEAAQKTVALLGGALDRTMAALEPYFLQLRLENRSGDA